jgi:hypothetical protein
MTKDRMETKNSPLGVLALFAASIGMSFFTAYVTMRIWNLFIPQAFGLPELTFAAAFGLRLVIWCFLVHKPSDQKTTLEQDATKMGVVAVSYALSLGLALLVA